MPSSLRTPVVTAFVTASLLVTSAVRAEVVTLPYKGKRQIEELQARNIEILAATQFGLDVLAEGEALDYLRSRPYPISIRVDKPMREIEVLDANLGQYHTYAETEAMLASLASTYPAITQLSVLGLSIQGRNISALKISDNVTVDEDEPEVLYMGNHHARELISVEIPLLFAEYLLQNYGTNSTVTNYVNTREIYIVPMVNPDGHFYVQQNHTGSSGNWWRKNRRNNLNGTFGVDLNRNYGYEWGYDDVGSSPSTSNVTYRGPAPFSEPETQIIRNFVNAHEFVSWFSYHSYGNLLLYGWGYIPANTPDHAAIAALADTLVIDNGLLAGNPASGAIYITNGASDDWGYGEQVTKPKIFAYTPEIGTTFDPPESAIAPTFALLLPMNMKLLEFADNPYRVVGPWTPEQNPVQAPYANAVTRLSWEPQDPEDPNAAVSYTVEACLDPSTFTDAATPAASGWTLTAPFAYSATGFAGGGYHSGNANNIASAMTFAQPLVVDAATDTLRFKANYDIEDDYDYAYAEVSTDGGASWTSIAGNITTAFNPNGLNRGHGITGSSAGWVDAVFPLTAYLGQDILVRISYVTDGAALGAFGLRVDNISPVPACGSITTIATGITGTQYDHVPPSTGLWRYRIRAIDAENHASSWSNSRDRNVETLTDADDARVYRSALGANYPNPFNPSTRIPFVVGGADRDGATPVVLAIYSVTGARITELVRESRRPGTYVAYWDGLDQNGRPAASGIYFARLEVGPTRLARKLVLLK